VSLSGGLSLYEITSQSVSLESKVPAYKIIAAFRRTTLHILT
jgi:hypothetical protein